MLDRTKEPGASGEPLYQDVVTAFAEAPGRWPPRRHAAHRRRPLWARVEGVHAGDGQGGVRESRRPPPRRTTSRSASTTMCRTRASSYDPRFVTEAADDVGCIFYGLGADGTVGANKNSIKIIGEETPGYAQGFFVYDSKKSGSRTTSHLRFGPQPIRSAYLVQRAQFVACHQFEFVDRVEMLNEAADGARVPAQQPFCPGRALGRAATLDAGDAPRQAHPSLHDRRRPRRDRGRHAAAGSTRSCRPASSRSRASCRATRPLPEIKDAIQATYGAQGDELVESNFAAVDRALENLHEVPLPASATSTRVAAADRARPRARLRPAGHRDDDRGARRRAAGQRAPG